MGLKKDQIYLNIEKFGNMSAASSAVALVEAVKKGLIKKGDKIVLDAFGGGLTWGAMVIEWSK
jgi:3-oxoacyl-[acyl-carrier-protein] synthase-3